MSKKNSKGKTPSKSTTAVQYKGTVSLVIPCYNEAGRLDHLLNTLKSFDQKWTNPLEIILVDDGSTDETAKIIQQKFPNSFSGNTEFNFLKLPENAGKGGALKAGVATATGDYVLTLDADMATRPQELSKWLKQLPKKTFNNKEILIGSREHAESTVEAQGIRRLAGWIFNFFIQLFTNLNLRDTQCGFKLYPQAAAQKLFGNLRSNGWAHDVELLYRAKLSGYNIKSMPVKWDAMDDSKINLFTDSIKMFWQTVFISLRVNWDFFVKQPIQELKNKSWNASDPSYYRLLFLVTAVALFFLMPMLSFDYGITGDEHVQKEYGEKVMAWFDTDGKDDSALNYKNLYYYGGMFDYYAARLHSWFPSWDVYELRHAFNSFVGFLLMLFTGLLARQVSGSWRAGFFGLLFIVLAPRIFGHAMNNPKDIPFAAAYVFTLLYMLRFMEQLPRPSKKTILLLILGIAAAINVRVGGILLIAYFGLFTILSFLLKNDLRPLLKNTKVVSRTFLTGLLVVIGGYFAGMLYWPYAQEAPLSNPFKALSEMSNFSTSIRMLFNGEHLWSDELPWSYIPHWIMITAPIFMLLGLVLFLVFYFIKFNLNKRMVISFLAFTAIFPVSYAIFKGSQLYDGMRHFLFVMPVLATLAAWGWHRLISLKPGIPALAASGVLAILLTLPAYWMIKNHPYQGLYFNELSGGLKNAYGKYETDYWMVSIKNMSDWLLENEPRIKAGEKLIIRTNAYQPFLHYMTEKAPNVTPGYVAYADRYKYPTDYFMFITRFVDKGFLENGHFPPVEVVHEERVDGVLVGVITKRVASFDAEAAQVVKTRDFQKAAQLYEQQLQVDPANESTLENAIKNAMNMQDNALMKKYADQLGALSDTYASGAYYQGVYHNNTGNVAEAKKYLEKTVDLNYKYSPAYYYLSAIYARESNFVKALDAVEMYDEVGGNAPQVYDIGIQVGNQLGAKSKVLYLQAKKAYFQKDYQNSFNLVKQSVALDPNYERAENLVEMYNKSAAGKQ